MTYDPNNPRGIPPQRISSSLAAGIGLAVLLILGVIVFTVINRTEPTTITRTSPPATTGQTQNSPAPTPTPPKAQ